MTEVELLKVIAKIAKEKATSLDLSSKNIKTIPPEIANLTNLTTLGLHNNKITEIPEAIANLISLTILDLSDNQITEIPEAIANLKNLRTLYLYNNKITEIPEAIANLTNLTELYLFDNQITEIPKAIANLTNLTELVLSNNQITKIPEAIANLKNLTELNLRNNQITEIPEAIANLTNLTKLDLHNNQITEIPEAIANLTNLTRLDLSNNQITEIPKAIANLTNLRALNLYNNQITEIPEAIANLTNLTTLYLSDNQITEISEAIANLTNLTTLYLSDNQITEIPEAIAKLTNLTTLIFNNNQITKIPDAIANLTNLTTLYLHNNQITEIPEAIANLTKLKRLDFHNNQITEIPDAIANLTKLKRLDFHNNQITEIPDAITNLTNLTTLYLHNNQITEIPEAIANLKNLAKLDLYSNKITEIPEVIAKLTNLTTLYLSKNQITEIPEAIVSLPNLTTLYLRNNQITEIPEAITNLTNLTELALINNQITEIPEAIANLTNLTKLYLSENQITEIPEAIANLTNLTILDLSNNQITEIPKAIANLTNLTILDLHNNQITEIPEAIANLKNLTTLFLSNNQITEIPEAIANLTNLKMLDLRNNPIPIPVEILNDHKNPQKILDYYFRQRSEQQKPLNEGKLIVVGQGAVGKTALVSQLIDNCWEDEGKTEGIKIRQWLIKARDTDVQLNVWDFGGQEIMHATHQFFLTERSLYLLVLNNRENERANEIDRWLKIIQSFGKNSPILIVGNWTDQHPLDLDQKGWQTKYPNIKGFFATACKDNVVGITELRQAISIEIGKMDSVFVTLPQTYFNVKSKIEQLEQQGKDYIPYTDYQTICKQQKIAKQSEQRNLAQILHDLGIALNFADDYRLAIKDTYVLNPGWIVGGVYKILNDNLLMTRDRGILEIKECPRIFTPKQDSDQNRYPTSQEHQFVIDMMLKFELCFDLDSQPAYLIPDLLTKEEPDTGTWEQSLQFELHYEVLPQSIMSRFIVKSHKLISKKTYWRTGVVLIKDEARAYIKADLDDGKIFIRIIGNSSTRRSLLSIIRKNFDAIHKTIAALPVKERVPLPDNPTVTVSYKHLLIQEEKSIIEFIPEDTDKSYNIRELLEGIQRSSDRHKIERKSQEKIMPRTKIFVSYSHEDVDSLKEFKKQISPYERAENFDIWDDSKINAGDEWRIEINKALAAAKVAVLLVSPNFIASKFIHEKELPPLLDAAESKGLTIIWIPISASSYKKTAIEKYQSAHPPNEPLDSLDKAKCNQAWVKICEKIETAMKKSIEIEP